MNKLKPEEGLSRLEMRHHLDSKSRPDRLAAISVPLH